VSGSLPRMQGTSTGSALKGNSRRDFRLVTEFNTVGFHGKG
jgi:hypothetical protein